MVILSKFKILSQKQSSAIEENKTWLKNEEHVLKENKEIQ